MKLILTFAQARTVFDMMEDTDFLHGRMSVQFDTVSVMYTPASPGLGPQVTVLHAYADTEHYRTPREFARRYGLEF